MSINTKLSVRVVIPIDFAKAPVIGDITKAAIKARLPDGLCMEFGVYRGRSLRRIRSLIPLDVKLYGFDSFKGIPSRWMNFPAGTFATDYRIRLPNTELVEGEFAETVPRFASLHYDEPVSFMHIDCDLYLSTKIVLSTFRNQLVPGSVILFDELIGYEGYEQHEYRALVKSGIKFEVIGRWDIYRAAIKVQ